MSLAQLTAVEWSMNGTGARLHPVGIIEPTRMDMGRGAHVMATRVDLYSWQWIEDIGLQIGEILSLYLAGDVLVNVQRIAAECDEHGSEQPLQRWRGSPINRAPIWRPKTCLCCGGPLTTLTRTGEAIAAHQGGNVASFGAALHGVHRCAGACDQALPAGVENLPSLVGLSFDALVAMPGIGPAKAGQILAHSAKTKPPRKALRVI